MNLILKTVLKTMIKDENETNDEDDLVMNEIGESEDESATEEEENEPEEITFVPKLETITRHGRAAGTWNSCMRR